MAKLFSTNNLLDIQHLKSELDLLDIDILKDYIDFLINEELAFYVNSIEEYKMFPKLNLEWEYPAIVSNMIIDIDKDSNHNLESIIKCCENINCRHIQIRFFDETLFSDLQILLKTINESNVICVELFIPAHAKLCNKDLISLIKKNKKISNILLYNYCKDMVLFNQGEYGTGTILCTRQNLNTELLCGNFHFNYFVVNIDFFSESQKYNTCLNRKICIDKKGFIKNCPSMRENFGKFTEVNLKLAIENPQFIKYWHINKDNINKCCDCEFRYICIDCRAYTENIEDIHSAPLKCGYNPYTLSWSNWSDAQG